MRYLSAIVPFKTALDHVARDVLYEGLSYSRAGCACLGEGFAPCPILAARPLTWGASHTFCSGVSARLASFWKRFSIGLKSPRQQRSGFTSSPRTTCAASFAGRRDN